MQAMFALGKDLPQTMIRLLQEIPNLADQLGIDFSSLMTWAMEGYVKEGIYLERMREAGNSDDSHSLFSVHISTYFGQGVRYTSNVYPRQDLPGATSQVFITEAWLIKKGVGYYLIHYRSRRRNFQKFYPDFKKFTGYLAFEPKVKKEETYP